MLEIAIPTFTMMHPLTAINSMHASCIRNVEAANILKRDQSLSYWSQVHSNSKRSTAERNLQGPGGPVITDVYEESISTQIQGLVVLQRVNISLIQSSVVEEVISFSALDNVQDLSCASLLAISLDGISTRLHLGKTTRASIHTVYTQPAVRSSGLKKGRIMKGTRALLCEYIAVVRVHSTPCLTFPFHFSTSIIAHAVRQHSGRTDSHRNVRETAGRVGDYLRYIAHALPTATIEERGLCAAGGPDDCHGDSDTQESRHVRMHQNTRRTIEGRQRARLHHVRVRFGGHPNENGEAIAIREIRK